MAAQALALREKGAEYTLSSQIADSRTAYALSLYAKISNITWDYEAPPGKIAGCEFFKIATTCSTCPLCRCHISIRWHWFTATTKRIHAGVGNDKMKAFKTFSIDSRSKTSFEVANTLWDLIGEGVETTNWLNIVRYLLMFLFWTI